ncbi:hypothetical protein SAMN04488058_11072 [Deinococcus reticulitermitis]|uniref:Glycosyltransferase 2-like domain-containing protein n=1 Tax=Deinococcus reticulitermitis TaxID=856736 RepID=A0A1H6ZMK2_9DEIO|nr:glycosyltransferase family 2 protein [Deinococcus reticulitermitis]SEJ54723.1 hypothetical protein SAMN04488058_11072 [Deinococcus reticulitermitis]
MYTNRVAVILLNWRNYSDTLECIDSIVSSGIDLRDVIVVDNDSQDESVNIIRRSIPDLEVLESGHNGGFAYGCNVGIRIALERNYPYIWLLNNDTLVNKQTLSEMLNIFSKPANREIGIVGSLIRYLKFPYEIQALGGGSINYLTGQTKNILEFGNLDRLDYITGASMLISRRVFERIGLLDERYFMYWEDVEFCVRAKKAGFGVAVATESVVLHKEGASIGSQSPKKILIQNEAQTKFFRSHYKFWPFTILTNSLGRSIKSIVRGDLKSLKYLWKKRI